MCFKQGIEPSWLGQKPPFTIVYQMYQRKRLGITMLAHWFIELWNVLNWSSEQEAQGLSQSGSAPSYSRTQAALSLFPPESIQMSTRIHI